MKKSTRILTIGAVALVLAATKTPAATKYWDTTAGAGNGVGGSGTWGTTFSNSASGDATLSTSATTDDDIFQGTAGTITLSASQTANTLTFNTTNYVITGNSTTNRTITGSISLGANINLTIGNSETTDIAIGVGNVGVVSGTSGSQLTINAAATGTAVTRLNLSTGTAPNISVPIVITGTGFANIVAGTTGTQVTNTVTGNGSRLNIGATSSTAITFTQKIDNGTGTVRIAAGSSGGSGVVTLSGTGNNWGATELNNTNSGILRMGAVNALPTSTTLIFGATTASGVGASIVELSGNNTTIGQLTNLAQSGGILRNTSATAATLTVSGSDTTAATFSGVLQDGIGAGTLSLVRSGTGTTTLSAANTYSGSTSVSAGTLTISTGSINNSTSVSVSNVGALTLQNATALADAGTLSLMGSSTTVNLSAGSATTETIAALTLNGIPVNQGTYTYDVLNSMAMNDGIMNNPFSSANGETLTITPVPEPATVLGGLLLVGALGWNQRRRLGGLVGLLRAA